MPSATYRAHARQDAHRLRRATFARFATPLTPLVAAVLLAAAVAPAPAQQWSVGAQAGRIRSALDPARASSSFAVGLRYDAADAGLRASAGVPTRALDALWAGAALWKRAALRHRGFIAGVDVGGNVFLTRDRTGQREPLRPPGLPGLFDPPLAPVADLSGYALAGQALPIIGYEGRRFRVHARAGVSHYTARFGEVDAERTVRLADVELALAPTASLAIVPALRRYEADGEQAVTSAGASAVLAHERGSLWGRAAHWLDVDDVAAPWAAGATLRLHPRATIEAAVHRDTFDPLYMQPAQTSWTLGVSFQFSGPTGPAAPPVPDEYVDGRATIRLPVSESPTQPSIAGDFTGWKPAPMRRSGDDWSYTVALVPGVYNYAFMQADGTWFVPESVPGRREDGMGGHVAVLIVEPTSPARGPARRDANSGAGRNR